MEEKIALFPYEPWSVTEREFNVEKNHFSEAIFSLGNGYMGMRGTLEEDYTGPDNTTTPGMYINGVYASEGIIYGEEAPDLPEKSQTIINIAEWSNINIYLDMEKLDLLKGEVRNYRRALDMKKGVLEREFIWESSTGKQIQFWITRFLSQSSPHTGLVIYKFKPLNFSGSIRLVTRLDGNSQNYHFPREKKLLAIEEIAFQEDIEYLVQRADSTGIQIFMAVANYFDTEKVIRKESREVLSGKLISQYDLEVREGEEYCLSRHLAVYTSLDLEYNKELHRDDLKELVLSELKTGLAKGSQVLLTEHLEYMKEYWEDMDIKIAGDPALQQAFRYNALQLLQSVGRDGKTNIAAKGLTGEFYEGHYFWDTEIYIIPFFLYSRPEFARSLLMYRYDKLDKARENARRMKLDGALYPWRTINGEEASGFFMGSTVQYHINADIAYAIYQYYHATGDKEFLYRYGVEILAETARMWTDRGDYIPLKGNKFCINVVCGPDEYTPGVNNNCYTNYMAKFNLEFALDVMKKMEKEEPDLYTKLKRKINLEDEELKEWEKAAEAMYLPFSGELGIHPQDDSFLYKKQIDISTIPAEEIPLVRNWHPLIIWRYQLIKQADVILLMFLLGDQFTLEEKRANYDFYEPRTIHDSSLSPAIYSIIASEIGYADDAYKYFMRTARIDLDDYNGNTYQGLHTAGMAGSWLALIQGFAGMRNHAGKLFFSPRLPDKWEQLEFKVKYQKRIIKVVITKDKTEYTLISGEGLKIYHNRNEILLEKGKSIQAP